MKIDILTLFPQMFNGFLNESIIKRALENKKVEILIRNIRDYSKDKHQKVDDTPYGGGAGMVLMCQPIFDAVKDLKQENTKVVLLTPQGVTYNQKLAETLSKDEHLILICGHYEGFDERIISLADMEVSIGDYVLTGGELPAMVITDSITRLVEGVIEKESIANESFMEDLLDYPTYTKPREYEGMKVPDVLLNGNHKEIEKWRQTEKMIKTLEKRPDLVKNKKTGYVLIRNHKTQEVSYFEYTKINGLEITPKNDPRRDDIISINKMIIIKKSFIEKIAKIRINKKLGILLNEFNNLLLSEDDDEGTAALLGEAVKYRDYIISTYIKYLGEEYRHQILKQIQIVIKELNRRLNLIAELKEKTNEDYEHKTR